MSQINPCSDQDVVRAVLAGDRDRFRVLVERFHRPLFRTMLGLAGNVQDAEDIVQEAFAKAYAALATFKLEYPFYPWLHAIAYNVFATNVGRSARLRTVAMAPEDEDEEEAGREEHEPWSIDPSDGPSALVEQDDVRQAIWAAVRALPEEFQSVIVMRLMHDLSYLEICQATGLPIGTVKSRLARARERLAAILAAELD